LHKRTYARLSGNTGRNHDDISTSQCFLETVIGGQEPFNFGRGSDMRKVHGHPGRVYNIIKSELYKIYYSLYG
jgi:hypothetical protein